MSAVREMVIVSDGTTLRLRPTGAWLDTENPFDMARPIEKISEREFEKRYGAHQETT